MNDFTFNPKDFLNKLLSFNLKKTNEDQVIYKIIEKLPKDNDKYYTDHLNDWKGFVIRENKKRKEKPDLFTTIFTIEKKLATAENRANISS